MSRFLIIMVSIDAVMTFRTSFHRPFAVQTWNGTIKGDPTTHTLQSWNLKIIRAEYLFQVQFTMRLIIIVTFKQSNQEVYILYPHSGSKQYSIFHSLSVTSKLLTTSSVLLSALATPLKRSYKKNCIRSQGLSLFSFIFSLTVFNLQR